MASNFSKSISGFTPVLHRNKIYKNNETEIAKTSFVRTDLFGPIQKVRHLGEGRGG